MACLTRKLLGARALMVGTLLMMTAFATGCPFPVQYQLEPEEENQPPVVNEDYTDPYVVMREDLAEGTIPQFTIYVDDPNPSDTLQLKVVKNLQNTWFPQDPPVPHEVLKTDINIGPSYVLPPEDASNLGVSDTMRKRDFSLDVTPCPITGGTSDYWVFLYVCVTDGVFQAPPPDHPNENPCIALNGYAVKYPVNVHCIPDIL